MSRETLKVGPHLHSYLLSVSLRESEVLAELRSFTAEHPGANMQIAPEQGQFMAFLVKLLGVERILEIGTYTGYSALAMAEALPDQGNIVTLDIDSDTGAVARSYWEKAGVAHKIEQRIGPARESLLKLQGPFDLVFIDADKTNYGFYYEHSLKLLKVGGVVLLDNVLWSGRVARPEVDDPDTNALRAINSKIHNDDRVDLTMLPLADGLTMARKR